MRKYGVSVRESEHMLSCVNTNTYFFQGKVFERRALIYASRNRSCLNFNYVDSRKSVLT